MGNQLSDKLNTKMDIDFLKMSLKVYAFIPLDIEKIHNSNLFNQAQRIIIDLRTREKQLTIINKVFEISDNYNSVIIDGITYEIPICFNRNSMRLNDVKTWEKYFIKYLMLIFTIN